MRKIALVTLCMLMGLSMTTASFAAVSAKETTPAKHEAAQVVKGKITAVNAAANQITVQDGSKTTTVTVNNVASFKEGMHVKITLKAGTTDQAENVKVIAHKNKK